MRAVLVPFAAGTLALAFAVFAGWAALVDDPLGGEPMAASAVPQAEPSTRDEHAEAPAAASPAVPASQAAAPAAPAGANTKTVTIIDGTSGSRRDIQVPATGDGKPANEQSVSEPSRHGPLPKIAADGIRPSQAFARVLKPVPGMANAPRVALVIGGLGISANNTADALRKLPAAVTLAFAPYGDGIERQAAQAREKGHELLLQVPMEPFDYPDNDPGPQTLLTSLDAGQNIDRLHWSMSRFQGYVGIANAMGGRFSVSEQALGPVLREAAKRGLIYFDDATSARSLASQIAGANNLPFAKADLVIDTAPTPADLDRALARLETAARAKGVAIGFASALPVSIDRIARWAKAAESRGILLVPITAVVTKAGSS
jgi:polysaccharide deacetylase 2 family uncharacterized protein YibQ